MGVYTRFKKNPDGLRQLVELLESTPSSRREHMIEVGMTEDPEYTQEALKYMFTFEDVMQLPDLELAEVISESPSRVIACAIYRATDEVKNRFLLKAVPRVAAEIKEFLSGAEVSPGTIAAGQTKLIEVTRKLEKRGLIKTKRVPS